MTYLEQYHRRFPDIEQEVEVERPKSERIQDDYYPLNFFRDAEND